MIQKILDLAISWKRKVQIYNIYFLFPRKNQMFYFYSLSVLIPQARWKLLSYKVSKQSLAHTGVLFKKCRTRKTWASSIAGNISSWVGTSQVMRHAHNILATSLPSPIDTIDPDKFNDLPCRIFSEDGIEMIRETLEIRPSAEYLPNIIFSTTICTTTLLYDLPFESTKGIGHSLRWGLHCLTLKKIAISPNWYQVQ